LSCALLLGVSIWQLALLALPPWVQSVWQVGLAVICLVLFVWMWVRIFTTGHLSSLGGVPGAPGFDLRPKG
jgi:hypothetical protein